ncbi:phosphatase PAP2 family protein [Rickettsiales bacterium LUAb2]
MEITNNNKYSLYRYVICVVLIFAITFGATYYQGAIFPAPNQQVEKSFYFPQDGYLSKTGSVLRYALPAGALFVALAVRDTGGAMQLINSFSITFAITYTLKKFIHEERPLHQGNNSFPSGHTANSFSAVWFFLRRYGFSIPFIITLVLAFLTAFSRVATGWHHVQDVLFSLVLSAVIGYFWVKPFVKKS